MSRRLFLALALAVPGTLHAEQPDAPTIGNRSQPYDSQLLAHAKSFCVEMRRHHVDNSTREFRHAVVDPRYLAEHGLERGDVPLEMAPVGDILSVELAGDERTILCTVSTADAEREAILLRACLHEKRLYFTPPQPPDERTGRVTPWLLRTVLDE